jgi:hypothetical protein
VPAPSILCTVPSGSRSHEYPSASDRAFLLFIAPNLRIEPVPSASGVLCVRHLLEIAASAAQVHSFERGLWDSECGHQLQYEVVTVSVSPCLPTYLNLEPIHIAQWASSRRSRIKNALVLFSLNSSRIIHLSSRRIGIRQSRACCAGAPRLQGHAVARRASMCRL